MKFEYAIFKNNKTGHFLEINKVNEGYRVRLYIFSSILAGQQTLEEALFRTKKEALAYKRNKGFRLEEME